MRWFAIFVLVTAFASFNRRAQTSPQKSDKDSEKKTAAGTKKDMKEEKKDESRKDEAKKDEPKKPGMNADTFSGLKFRSIGPGVESGRVMSIAVNPQKKHEFYVGVASGGVWKTVNDGTTWAPLFDGQGSYSIGQVALDPNDPSVVWVGAGESNSQRSVSYGDGIYRSDDGGKNWKNLGLKKSEHIGRVVIDPRDSKVVYVAAAGPLWGGGRRSRSVQDDRRRKELEGSADHQREHWRERRRHGPVQSRHSLCVGISAASARVHSDRWWPGERDLQVNGCGRDMDQFQFRIAFSRPGARWARGFAR